LASAPGRDVHEARHSGLFAITAGRRLLVKAERIDDEQLGCNSLTAARGVSRES
jgi:hypothetical protein